MRVDPNPLPDLLAALNQSEQAEQEATLEISSGKSVNKPSDNPTAAAMLIENNNSNVECGIFAGPEHGERSAFSGQFDTEFGANGVAAGDQPGR